MLFKVHWGLLEEQVIQIKDELPEKDDKDTDKMKDEKEVDEMEKEDTESKDKEKDETPTKKVHAISLG